MKYCRSSERRFQLITLLLLLVSAAACRPSQPAPSLPTSVAQAQPPVATATLNAGAVPPTWTPGPTNTPGSGGTMASTLAPRATRTPGVFPSHTPLPSPTPQDTPTPQASETPLPTETPTPLPAVTGDNLLSNPSFEEGWYHIDGIPELQVPNQWQLDWESGTNPLDHDPAPWVRPESRVLTPDFLPAREHAIFIWDGSQTVKIFKGQGALSFRLTSNVHLEPGSYLLEIHVFPDLVDEYVDGQKVWAPDPLSGEVRLVVGDHPTDWVLPAFGQKNTFTHAFRVDTPQDLRIGAAMRGRWAIENNGWFMDDWSLTRIGD